MKSGSSAPKFARIMFFFLFSAFLLVTESSNVQASTSPSGPNNNYWMISVEQSKDPICVGDVVNVEVQWGSNTTRPVNGKDGLVSLAPLAGPSLIKMTAQLGHFYPEDSFTPGATSGVKTVTYIADKEGSESLSARAMSGENKDAIAHMPFSVKTCDFIYTLNGELNLNVEMEGLSYSSRFTIKSKGTLKAPDPSQPLNVEGKDKVVYLSAVITSFSAPKCVLFTWEPGTGGGFVDVKAAPGPNGIGMELQFGPPQELEWTLNFSMACNGQGQTGGGVYPSTDTQDPWISAMFLSGSGQQNIKLDMFEIPMNKLNGHSGISVSYTATVTLEKVLPK